MYELTGNIQNLAIDIKTQKAVLTVVINEKNDVCKCFDELRDAEKIAVKIDKYRVKRSLNANAYAWLLIGKIADDRRLSKEEVYLRMLKHYGQSEVISVLSCIPLQGLIKYYEEIGESNLNGKDFKHYRVFKGSSEFDTREMSIFIDGIVTEGQELGIPTMAPAQIAEMKSLWAGSR